MAGRSTRTRAADNFAARVLAWYDAHGRKDLPWQQDPTPYRVWVSEIMLQQTQVATVLGYFDRFLARFPDVFALAVAPVDDVLHLWTGLGYYARARNLHRAAGRIASEFSGVFPRDIDTLASLPGIGRSTAGAILALAGGERAPILDGNVKRVLARFHAVDGDRNDAAVLRQLWQHAEAHTPHSRLREYTQAMMDLGATVCTRSRPRCTDCPLATDCVARIQGNPQEYPGRSMKPRSVPVRSAILLLLRDTDGHVLLERRPAAGLWGGLWSLPQCADDGEVATTLAARGLRELARTPLSGFRHTFSHFHLDISPLVLDVTRPAPGIAEGNDRAWVMPDAPGTLGLAAPVVRLLGTLAAPRAG